MKEIKSHSFAIEKDTFDLLADPDLPFAKRLIKTIFGLGIKIAFVSFKAENDDEESNYYLVCIPNCRYDAERDLVVANMSETYKSRIRFTGLNMGMANVISNEFDNKNSIFSGIPVFSKVEDGCYKSPNEKGAVVFQPNLNFIPVRAKQKETIISDIKDYELQKIVASFLTIEEIKERGCFSRNYGLKKQHTKKTLFLVRSDLFNNHDSFDSLNDYVEDLEVMAQSTKDCLDYLLPEKEVSFIDRNKVIDPLINIYKGDYWSQHHLMNSAITLLATIHKDIALDCEENPTPSLKLEKSGLSLNEESITQDINRRIMLTGLYQESLKNRSYSKSKNKLIEELYPSKMGLKTLSSVVFGEALIDLTKVWLFDEYDSMELNQPFSDTCNAYESCANGSCRYGFTMKNLFENAKDKTEKESVDRSKFYGDIWGSC